MMFGLMRVRTHDAEMAKVRAELAAAEKRVFDAEYDRGYTKAHNKDLQARLDALTPARGQGGRFAKREAV